MHEPCVGRGLNSYLNRSLKNRFFNLGTRWDHKHTSTVPDRRGERHCCLSLCESGRTVRTMMVQGAHSTPPPLARVALNVSTWKRLSPMPMWCYSERKHTTELRTRETQRPSGQLRSSFQIPAPTAFSSKHTACHKSCVLHGALPASCSQPRGR